MGLVMRWLRQPKLWITLASLVLIGIALVQQGGQLREQTLDARGWWWLLLGLGISWISILVNGAAWRLLSGCGFCDPRSGQAPRWQR